MICQNPVVMVCFIASVPTKSLYRSNVPQRVYLMHVAAGERMHDIRSPVVEVWYQGITQNLQSALCKKAGYFMTGFILFKWRYFLVAARFCTRAA